ncbi:hypothetical protein D3C80_2004280 [compost metagenome]
MVGELKVYRSLLMQSPSAKPASTRLVFATARLEVLLLDLRQPGEFTDDLFAITQAAAASG